MKPIRRESGIAIVATLLLTTVVLISVLSAVVISAIGSLRTVGGEREAFRALLVAESAVAAFPHELSQADYQGVYSASALNTWASENGPYASPTGDTATWTVTARSGPTVTVSAVSNAGGGSKVVRQDFTFLPGNPLNTGALAPLTSHPDVFIRGDSSVAGASYLDGISEIPSASTAQNPVVDEIEGTLTVDLSDTSTIRDNAYVRIGNDVYKATSVTREGSQLEPNGYVNPGSATLVPVTFDEPSLSDLWLEIKNRSDEWQTVPISVTSIPFAVAQTNSTDVSQVVVNNPNGFVVGECIRYGSTSGSGNTYTARVLGITGSTLSVNWSDGTCPGEHIVAPSSLQEGVALTRDVVAVESHYGVSESGNSTVTNGTREYSERLADQGAMFELVFGMTLSDFEALSEVQSVDSIESGVAYNGVYVAQSGFSGKSMCGSGILVIKGDVRFTAKNQDCLEGFKGIVYVTGNFDHSGNSPISGAIVVEGQTYVDDPETTDITGTACKAGDPCDAKIAWDLQSVLSAGALVQLPGGMEPVAGTWRQR